MSTKKSDRLLRTDVHTLADSTRFSKPADPTMMTLDSVPDAWMSCFARAKTQAEWDIIIKATERARPSIYFEARRQCAGRDSRSQRIEESRERAAAFLDSL
jgi:hypothetical protein